MTEDKDVTFPEVENTFKLIDAPVTGDFVSIAQPKYVWKCKLFGMGDNYYIQFTEDQKVPNWFWRKMQYLLFGCQWERLP